MTQETDALRSTLTAITHGVALRVKVVPGASRTQVVGVLGDRLKIAVAAPPDAGKANDAACQLLGKVLGIPRRDVRIASGQSQPFKTIELAGVSLDNVADRLGQTIG